MHPFPQIRRALPTWPLWTLPSPRNKDLWQKVEVWVLQPWTLIWRVWNRNASIFPKSSGACSDGLGELCHLPGTESTCGNPHVAVAMPVLILRRPEHGSQCSTYDTGRLIDLDMILEESPSTIDHLSSGFAANKALLTRHFVCDNGNIVWRLPFPLAMDLDFLLAAHDVVAHHARDLTLVGLRSISM